MNVDAFHVFTHKEFHARMRKEFSSIVHLGNSKILRLPSLGIDPSLVNGNLLVNLDVFSDAIIYGGVRYFSSVIVEVQVLTGFFCFCFSARDLPFSLRCITVPLARSKSRRGHSCW